MATKPELLLTLLETIRQELLAIQKQRFDYNANENSLKSKKRVTDENFQKLIKLKNEDFNKILNIENEILAGGENSADFSAYKDDGIKEKILTIGKCFDQTFGVVDQMKRETEFLENTSTEFEDESLCMTADKSNDYDENKNLSNSGDSNSNSTTSEAVIEGKQFLQIILIK